MQQLDSTTVTYTDVSGKTRTIVRSATGSYTVDGRAVDEQTGADLFVLANRLSSIMLSGPTTAFGQEASKASSRLVDAIEKGKLLDAVMYTGQVAGVVCDFIGAPPMEPVSLTGLPQRDGEVAAGRAVAAALRMRPGGVL